MTLLRSLLGRRLARRIQERHYRLSWWWRQHRIGHRIRRAARLLTGCLVVGFLAGVWWGSDPQARADLLLSLCLGVAAATGAWLSITLVDLAVACYRPGRP